MSQHANNQFFVVAALITILSVTLVGCSLVESDGGEDDRLLGRWGLHEVTYAGGSDMAPHVFEDGSVFTLSFETEGRLGVSRAFDSCNTCGGNYELPSSNAISMAVRGPCTEIACSVDDPEFPAGHESHGDALSRATSYQISVVAGRTILLIHFEDQHGAGNWLTYRSLDEEQ